MHAMNIYLNVNATKVDCRTTYCDLLNVIVVLFLQILFLCKLSTFIQEVIIFLLLSSYMDTAPLYITIMFFDTIVVCLFSFKM